MSKITKIFKILFLISPLIIIPLVIIFRTSIIQMGNNFAPCVTYLMGFYCPGCGNTRALIALLRGDIIASIRFNPIIVFFTLFLIAFYVESFADFIKKDVKIIPRNGIFWIILGGLAILFYILRNFIDVLSPSFV